MQPTPIHSPERSSPKARHPLSKCWVVRVWLLLLLLGANNLFAEVVSGPAITSLAELQNQFATNRSVIASFRLEGVICSMNSGLKLVALQDDSGTVLLELPRLDPGLRPGMWLAVTGDDCALTRSSFAVQVCGATTAEIDGQHPVRSSSGSVFLSAGPQPLRVDWFNGTGAAYLGLEYEGPGVIRQPIPDTALTRRIPKDTDTTTGDFQMGLNFEAYEGDGWTLLPDFQKLKPVTTGVVPNFDINRRTRPDNAALVFNGFLQVSNAGIYTFYLRSDDGGRICVGNPTARLKVTALERKPQLPVAHNLTQTLAGRSKQQWAFIEGKIGFANYHEGMFEFEVKLRGRPVSVLILDGAAFAHTNLVNRGIRVTGVCQSLREEESDRTPRLIVIDAEQLKFIDAPDSLSQSETLTTAAQVRSLHPEEARKGVQVRVRGVVTMATGWSCVLQDSSGGVFTWISVNSNWEKQPLPGELWQLEGVTDPGDFSPLLNTTNAIYLGTAILPEPILPTWEQLMNGSLDAEQVEIQGVVLEEAPSEMTVLTHNGKVKILAKDGYPLPSVPSWEAKEHSLRGSVVRIRGVLTAEWDQVTRRVKPGRFYLGNAVLSLEDAVPGNPFSVRTMRAEELLLFTSHIEAWTRVRVSGQVLHVEPRECILQDGAVGFRVMLNEPQPFQERDLVEAVGFPQLGGPSPVLLEARARKIGSLPRPAPTPVPVEKLSDRSHDATLVQLEAVLISDSVRKGERVLELQAGPNHFLARLREDGGTAPSLRPGSRLQLTGVYSSMRDEQTGNDLDSFELLLNRSADIVVLKTGPWWTMRHTITLVAALVAGLGLASVWITQLQRNVKKRTAQLAHEIEERQRVEQHRAMEQERARIAQDLHDDLGAGLAHIGLIGSLAQRHSTAPERAQQHLAEITGKSREMVAALDEIVWATNPKHDSSTSVSSYLCAYAEEFLRPTKVSCLFDVTSSPATRFSTSLQRHHLLLAFKEALTNVVKHAHASEVWIRVRVEGDDLCVVVEDNGRGMTSDSTGSNGDGLQNMRKRLEQIGGRCEIENVTAGGTVVRLLLPTATKAQIEASPLEDGGINRP
jgi:signal transduction histidine kinase